VPLETSRCRELLWLPLAGFYTVWLPFVLKWLRSSFQTPIMHNAFKYIIQAVFCVHFYSYRWCLVRQFAQGHEVKWLSEHLQTSILISSQPCFKHIHPKRVRFPSGIQQISSCFPSLPLSYRGEEQYLPCMGELGGAAPFQVSALAQPPAVPSCPVLVKAKQKPLACHSGARQALKIS